MNRKNFIKLGGGALGALIMASTPLPAWAAKHQPLKLVILHTNDVHSRIDPFPQDGGKYAGLGGVARRAALIAEVRAIEPHVLLLDVGDIWQGTPYFNFFDGGLEYDLMDKMGYDCVTLGNHDFDNGLEGLERHMPKKKFKTVCSNYDLSETSIAPLVQPYWTVNKGPLKIGIYGLGVGLKGLVPDKLYGATKYLDPYEAMKKQEQVLHYDEKCDLIICLSHMGYKYPDARPSDIKMAPLCTYTDLILGGHTHTFMASPEPHINVGGRTTLIHQVGFAGINLGRIDYNIDIETRKRIGRGSSVQIT